MFTDEELEGAPNDTFVDWVNNNEVLIDETIGSISSFSYHDMQDSARRSMIELLIACWNARKCPYA